MLLSIYIDGNKIEPKSSRKKPEILYEKRFSCKQFFILSIAHFITEVLHFFKTLNFLLPIKLSRTFN